MHGKSLFIECKQRNNLVDLFIFSYNKQALEGCFGEILIVGINYEKDK